ncbi:Uncharacterised protein [Vibrio cholerae]|uniref:Uncharacterized protein n=1 Tax=Vibrio cholerae TaxID=666 RepID=A0A655WMA4_VIBCL|nr:Uncharacterised protein [Vibrio cholerae]
MLISSNSSTSRTLPYTTMPSHSFSSARAANSASINARRSEPPPSISKIRPRPSCSRVSRIKPLSS